MLVGTYLCYDKIYLFLKANGNIFLILEHGVVQELSLPHVYIPYLIHHCQILVGSFWLYNVHNILFSLVLLVSLMLKTA